MTMRNEEYYRGILGALGVGEDKGVPKPVWRHEEYLQAIYDAVKDTMQPVSINSAAHIRKLVRNHTINKYLVPGDLIRIPKEASISTTVSGGLTAATVTEETFIPAIGHSETAAYEFVYDGAAWMLNENVVELANYGITLTGTPAQGDIIVVHVQADHVILETLGIGCDVPVNPALDNSVSFLTRDVQTYGSIARCAPQALVSVQEAIASGTTVYVVGNHCCFDGTAKQDGSFGFVAPVDIPVGAKLRHSTLGQSQNNAANYTKAAILAGKWTIYDANYSTLISDVATIETATGILLGAVTAFDPQYLVNNAAHVNYTQRNQYGSNRAVHSAHRKWLNSDASSAESGAIASWWAPSDEFDMPIRSSLPGFLHGIDPEFRRCIQKVWKRTAKSIADGYGYEDTQEMIWIPSMTEIGFNSNNDIVETSPNGNNGDPNWTGAYPMYVSVANKDRIKYQDSSARYWFLRSPNPANANYVRDVKTDGSLNHSGAYNTSGVVAGLTLA